MLHWLCARNAPLWGVNEMPFFAMGNVEASARMHNHVEGIIFSKRRRVLHPRPRAGWRLLFAVQTTSSLQKGGMTGPCFSSAPSVQQGLYSGTQSSSTPSRATSRPRLMTKCGMAHCRSASARFSAENTTRSARHPGCRP